MPGQNPLADRGIKKEGLNHPWMDLRLLENESFIMQLPGQRTRQAVDQLFREYHMEPNIKLQTSNITAEAALVSKGYGCCFVTESHLRHIRPLDNVSFFSVGSPRTVVDFVAAFRRGSYLPYHAREYISIVKDFT